MANRARPGTSDNHEENTGEDPGSIERTLNEFIRESESYSEIVNMALIAEKNNEEYVKARDQKKRAFNAEKIGEGSSKKTGWNSNKRHETSKGQAKGPDQDKPDKCQRCGGLHKDEQCRWNTGACFECGKKGHRVKDCPDKPAQPRLYQLINNCPAPNKKT
ncbi:hypothetical protein F0562_002754 [Nyssa sinensis]|uniref:CCHC-type domain-containing protein n=1 Tax=Nyssa sinensis TaxID=561372 RepID=A0A5J5BXP6_9ASTE|nr:hypothetical protein F0562_002754 [Nyssa sinensis]